MSEFFKKRKGTTNEGFQYEDINVANIVLNLVQDTEVKNFHLSSNDDTYGAFDDIVVDIETSKGRKTYALQLKHKRSGSLTIAQLLGQKGDFAIQKYFDSFTSNKIESVSYILYTNLECQIEENKLFQLEGKNFHIKLFRVSFKDEFKIVDNTETFYKFLIVEDTPSEESVAYRKFFDCFFLCTNQKNVTQLQKTVTNKFKTLFDANETEFDCYLKFITKWCKQEGLIEKLNKKWMQCALALIVLASRIKPLFFSPIDSKIKILQKAIDSFNLTVFKNESCGNVIKLWGDAITNLHDKKEINRLCKKFQFCDGFIDIDTIDGTIASKLLWVMGTCPLIVTSDKTVYKVIKLCPNQKFVLLEKNFGEGLNLPSMFRRLSDLDEKSASFGELVKICTCSLQGKNELRLEVLIRENRQFLEGIRTDDLVEMLWGVCNIAGEKEILSEPYIERFLTRDFINPSYLKSFRQDNIVIIDCVEEVEVLKTKQVKLICIDDGQELLGDHDHDNLEGKQFNSTIYYSRKKCDQKKFIEIYEKHKSTNANAVNQFRSPKNGGLEWIRSRGDVSDLQEYKTSVFIDETTLFSSPRENYINLIVADPGMGKSELMKSFKNKSPSDLWTVIISPKDVLCFCERTTSANDFVKVFENFLLDEKYKDLNDRDKLFYQNCVEQNKIIYIWDALDEITDEQREIVVSVIVKLSSIKRIQWVTTRSHLKKSLELEFSVIALNLTEFDHQTQKNYLGKRLKIDDEEIFEKIQSSFVLVEYQNILGIPLQLFMITELFLQNKDQFLTLLTNEFVLTDLYFYFIDEKIKLYLVEKEEIHLQSRVGKSLRIEALNSLEKLALHLLFSAPVLKSLNISFEVNEQKRLDCIALGLVTDFTNQIPRFFHNSFAEYLAAVYFSKNLHHVRNHLLDGLFVWKFMNVRFFLDLLLSKNCPTHLAVLYKNINFLRRHEDELKTSVDEAGRNALHLACAWGQKHPMLNVNSFGGTYIVDVYYNLNITPETKEYGMLLDYLLNFCDVTQTDKLLEITPLMYARRSNSLVAEIKMVKKQGSTDLQVDKQHLVNILYYTTLLGYDEALGVFETLNQEEKTIFANIKNMRGLTLLLIACDRGHEKVVRFLVASGAKIHVPDENNNTPLFISCLRGHEKIADFLIGKGSQINLPNNQGITPLLIACQNGHEKVVKCLVKNGSQVNIADDTGTSPLHRSIEKKSRKIMEFLVMNGSQLDLPNIRGFTPLHIASQNGYKDAVEFLVTKGAKINIFNKDCLTPLHFASMNGHTEVVELLVVNGAQVNLPDKNGVTPLLVASEKGHKKIVEILVANGAQVNAATKDGYTPLYISSKNGHQEIVEFLVANGSQLDLADKDGFTPLYVASEEGHDTIVEFLVTSGSQVNLASNDGYTPLFIASYIGREKIAKFLVNNGSLIDLAGREGWTSLFVASQKGHQNLVEFFLENGSQVDSPNENGITPLQVAAQSGHEKIVELLVENGSRINHADNKGCTALHRACEEGYENIVKFLVAKGSEVDFVDSYGVTPLHRSSREGHLNIVKFLVGSGSQVNLSEQEGRTPLLLASEQKHAEIVEFLLANGAQVDLPTRMGVTPLYVACCQKDATIVQMLVASGSNLDPFSANLLTPLQAATFNGDENIVKILVTNGAKVNFGGRYGVTPLVIAAQNGQEPIVKFLVANGSDVNIADKAGFTPLYVACQGGYEDIVEFLVANDAQVDLANKNGFTPLQIASLQAYEKIVEILIANGSQVDLADKDGLTPLYIATEAGHANIVELLVANGSKVNLANKNGFTPLYVASYKGYEKIVEFLLSTDSQPDVKNSFTPLYVACEQGHQKIVKILIAKGAQIEPFSENGFTPLQAAVSSGHDDIVDILVANGAQVNLVSKEGFSPLYIACQKGHTNIVKYLVKNGSQVNLLDKLGFTPLYVASQEGHEAIVEILLANDAQTNLANKDGFTPLYLASYKGDEKIVEFLVTNGATLDLAAKNGFTPLYVASEQGNQKIVEFLVAKGAQVEPFNRNGSTPLQVAASSGHENIVEFLVASGAQVDLANKDGFTPLSLACQSGCEKIVEFLIVNGAQINRVNKIGFTPLYIASRLGHESIVEFLVAKGAQVNLANEDGGTPLHGVCYMGYEKIVEFLIIKGAQVDLADKRGLTPIDVASKEGHEYVLEFLEAFKSLL